MDNLVHIGTSGWSYKHWRKNFYPVELTGKEYLNHYCQYFDTVEVNNSFYHLLKSDTVENWTKTAPAGFLFALKASRYITHIKKLKDAQAPVSLFFESIKPFNEKLGPILFQLPPRFSFNGERLESFLNLLSKDYKYTFEFRDKSWFNQETYNILKKYNIALCIYDLAGYQTPREVTSDFIYIRLHGPVALGSGKYNEAELEEFYNYIKEIKADNKSVFCYFNNDEAGNAVKNADELKHKLGL